MNSVIHAGILLNSALYLNGCFVAGLVNGNAAAWKLSLAAMGVTYVSYLAQAPIEGRMAPLLGRVVLVGLSIGLGLSAGLALLIG